MIHKDIHQTMCYTKLSLESARDMVVVLYK